MIPELKTLISAPYKAALSLLPDKLALSLEYFRCLGRFPDFRHPRRFTEKCQVRKLRDRDPRLPLLVDKVRAKDIVASTLGPDWIIPTLWHGETLPNVRDWPLPYVIKVNHYSGGNIFVRSKEEEDWPSIELKLKRWMSTRYNPHTREWPYHSITRQILVEPFIGRLSTELPIDFKLFVFRGRVEYIEVDTDRATNHKRSFYNREWVKQPFAMQYPFDHREVPRPATLNQMITAAERLSQGMSFLRVDFYELQGRPLFGEMTLFPDSGLGRFEPELYDLVFGDLM